MEARATESGSRLVRVDASSATGGAYDVRIGAGLLERLGALLPGPDRVHRWAVITDETVAGLYGQLLARTLQGAGLQADLLSVPPGESAKTRQTWAALTDAMLERAMGRDCGVIALGGGVVGDLAGFVAATFMRGVPCVQVPTTLLAMIDAATGGKTGVDVPAGKNLVGVFRQPELVVADTDVLRTLPADHYRAGMAEAVKHGAIADAAYLGWIGVRQATLERRDSGTLHYLIGRSIEIKADHVAADTLEGGQRAALNFGHTIAHALELVSGYRVPHGIAVAIGMVVEARLGEDLGITAPGTADALRTLLHRLGLPAGLPDGTDPASVLDATRTDKKGRAGQVRYTLLERLGHTARNLEGGWTFTVPADAVARVLDASLSADKTDV